MSSCEGHVIFTYLSNVVGPKMATPTTPNPPATSGTRHPLGWYAAGFAARQVTAVGVASVCAFISN